MAEHHLERQSPIDAHGIIGDMRSAALPPCDLVVILDVLHYVDKAAQRALLQRVYDALRPSGGRLLLRVGDADSRASR